MRAGENYALLRFGGTTVVEGNEVSVAMDSIRVVPGASIPAGRMATPEDIANACLYAGSPMAAYFAGTNLLLHGGGERPAFLSAGNAAQKG